MHYEIMRPSHRQARPVRTFHVIIFNAPVILEHINL